MPTLLMCNIEQEAPEGKMPPTMATDETKGAAHAAAIYVAYAEVAKTAKGTPKYNRALGDFILLLFRHVKPARRRRTHIESLPQFAVTTGKYGRVTRTKSSRGF
jgi:hypothetical protein